jgi:ubiquinol-cytochrome c reductase iron-sulfur subunit
MGQEVDGQKMNTSKRKFLIAATSAVGAAGAAAVAIPLLLSMQPSARAKAAGAPVEVDISKVEPGMLLTIEWRGKPVWILNRTKEMLDGLPKIDGQLTDPNSEMPQQPAYCKNATEKLKLGGDSGLGADWPGGFFCPCHGSRFDLAARVFKGVPAPVNLVIPPHQYLSDTKLLIGVDAKGA